MKILLADHHSLFVEGLQNFIQAGGYEVVGAEKALYLAHAAYKLAPDDGAEVGAGTE